MLALRLMPAQLAPLGKTQRVTTRYGGVFKPIDLP